MVQPRGSHPVASFELAAIVPEVRETLRRWATQNPDRNLILIDDIARAFYAKPRYADSLCFLNTGREPKPTRIRGFDRVENGYVDRQTGVRVAIVPAAQAGYSDVLVDRVLANAIRREGVLCASLEGMIALKLSRSESPKTGLQQQADIIDLIGFAEGFTATNMNDWPLTNSQERLLAELITVAT